MEGELLSAKGRTQQLRALAMAVGSSATSF
jgi:hypothetical protein